MNQDIFLATAINETEALPCPLLSLDHFILLLLLLLSLSLSLSLLRLLEEGRGSRRKLLLCSKRARAPTPEEVEASQIVFGTPPIALSCSLFLDRSDRSNSLSPFKLKDLAQLGA